jgi:hypothetical protein|tara:strand:- start:291 stop:527 length:237 start_codon:yes stop_codon:yes gene_type:complete
MNIENVINPDPITDFEMYTDKGNELVANIVKQAAKRNKPFTWVEQKLEKLGDSSPKFEEATDTAVREACYMELFGDLN